MVIASRTPEGLPGECPLCGSPVCIEPSILSGDAPCPVCGQLLWFVSVPPDVRLYPLDEVKPEVRNRVAGFLEASGEAILVGDSLDIIELVMELEELPGVHLSPEEVEQIRKPIDIIDAIVRKLQEGE